MSWKPHVALGLAAATWGVATTTAKIAVRGLGPFTTLAVELLAATMVLAVVKVTASRETRPPLRPLMFLALLEPIVAYGALNLGLLWADASQAALLDGLQTVFVLGLAAVFLREFPSPRAFACAIVVTGGAIVLVASNFSVRVGLGSLLVLLGALGASASVLVVSRLSASIGPIDLTLYPFALGAALCLPVVGISWATGHESLPGTREVPSICAAVATGVFAFAGAYLAYNYAVSRVSVGLAGAALSLVPLFGAISGVGLLGDTFTKVTLLGAALVVMGVLAFPKDQGDEIGATADADDDCGRRCRPRIDTVRNDVERRSRLRPPPTA